MPSSTESIYTHTGRMRDIHVSCANTCDGTRPSVISFCCTHYYYYYCPLFRQSPSGSKSAFAPKGFNTLLYCCYSCSSVFSEDGSSRCASADKDIYETVSSLVDDICRFFSIFSISRPLRCHYSRFLYVRYIHFVRSRPLERIHEGNSATGSSGSRHTHTHVCCVLCERIQFSVVEYAVVCLHSRRNRLATHRTCITTDGR